MDEADKQLVWCFRLFMFGFDGDDPTVFDETVKFNRDGSADVLIGSLDVASVEGGLSATT